MSLVVIYCVQVRKSVKSRLRAQQAKEGDMYECRTPGRRSSMLTNQADSLPFDASVAARVPFIQSAG